MSPELALIMILIVNTGPSTYVLKSVNDEVWRRHRFGGKAYRIHHFCLRSTSNELSQSDSFLNSLYTRTSLLSILGSGFYSTLSDWKFYCNMNCTSCLQYHHQCIHRKNICQFQRIRSDTRDRLVFFCATVLQRMRLCFDEVVSQRVVNVNAWPQTVCSPWTWSTLPMSIYGWLSKKILYRAYFMRQEMVARFGAKTLATLTYFQFWSDTTPIQPSAGGKPLHMLLPISLFRRCVCVHEYFCSGSSGRRCLPLSSCCLQT